MSDAWLSKKFLKELELRREDITDTMLAGCKDHAQYECLRDRDWETYRQILRLPYL